MKLLALLLFVPMLALAAPKLMPKEALKDYEAALRECHAIKLAPQEKACVNDVEERADPALKHNKVTDKQREQAQARARAKK